MKVTDHSAEKMLTIIRKNPMFSSELENMGFNWRENYKKIVVSGCKIKKLHLKFFKGARLGRKKAIIIYMEKDFLKAISKVDKVFGNKLSESTIRTIYGLRVRYLELNRKETEEELYRKLLKKTLSVKNEDNDYT